MFLLLGMRSAATLLFTVTFVCGQCGVQAPQQVLRLQQKVTAFFIPLFTLRTTWAVECSNCGIATGLTRQQAEHSQRWAGANPHAVA